MANFDATHPDYDKRKDDWALMRDAIEGERVVKEAGEAYLPKPSGFAQASNPTLEYENYKKRASFPEIVNPTVRGMWGVIHRQPAKVEMPEAMAFLTERATREGDTLNQLHERITRELLSTGRVGLLTDVPSIEVQATLAPELQGQPFIALYEAERVINWDKLSTFFVLDESDPVPDGTTLQWTDKEKHRVLLLQNGVYTFTVEMEGADAAQGAPNAQGGKALTAIPFVIGNAISVSNNVEEVPLLGVARCAFNIYQLDADYRHQLYMSGQETLVLTGVRKEDFPGGVTIGAMATIYLPEGGMADYVGPSGVGIESHRTAIEDQEHKAVLAGARLFEQAKGQVESGDALRIRFASQTATLTSIAKSSAALLERALRSAAIFLGIDPEQVIVTPNLSFIDSVLSAQDALNLSKIWQGGGMSFDTLYENLQKGEIANAERSVDEEKVLIEDSLPPPLPPGPGPADPNADPNAPTNAELFGDTPAGKPGSSRAARVANRAGKTNARRTRAQQTKGKDKAKPAPKSK